MSSPASSPIGSAGMAAPGRGDGVSSGPPPCKASAAPVPSSSTECSGKPTSQMRATRPPAFDWARHVHGSSSHGDLERDYRVSRDPLNAFLALLLAPSPPPGDEASHR